MRKRALDLFCGAGGAAYGILNAGFDEIVGVDIVIPTSYPGAFIQADLTEGLPVDIGQFDFVWASPPCQRYSIATKARGGGYHLTHPDLIPRTRELLAGHPMTCIENVPGSPLRQDLYLTGPMVGLERIKRKRYFEMSVELQMRCGQLPYQNVPRELWEEGIAVTVTTSMCSASHYYPRKRKGLSGYVKRDEAKEVMGLPPDAPMTKREIGESVPPAYAEYIARAALR